uniref:Uncharacterized protein n=1 Tax=Glossina pallidipes TaxID=7398 RepID=A0A1A9ZK85_GLOPL
MLNKYLESKWHAFGYKSSDTALILDSSLIFKFPHHQVQAYQGLGGEEEKHEDVCQDRGKWIF